MVNFRLQLILEDDSELVAIPQEPEVFFYTQSKVLHFFPAAIKIIILDNTQKRTYMPNITL